MTYYTFFVLGIVLYASAPWSGHMHHVALFVAAFCIILSMYGGGFATVPAYLADMFGTQMVGAIHGLLLTAWSAAGIFGPVIVNYMREFQLEHGVPRAQVYDTTAYIMCGLLAVGFVCNFLVKPVADKHFMTEAELEAERKLAHEAARAAEADGRHATVSHSPAWLVALAWLAVGIPIAWGVWITLEKAWILFK
jgi:MFS family permease